MSEPSNLLKRLERAQAVLGVLIGFLAFVTRGHSASSNGVNAMKELDDA